MRRIFFRNTKKKSGNYSGNGSRYIENEYAQNERITCRGFTSGVYQTLSYDDAHRRNTVYYSETGKTEVYCYS